MDPLRIGLIGVGGFARYRIGNLLQVPEARVVSMADTSAEQIALTKAKHPSIAEAREFSDYRELIGAGGLDAVMIQTPHTQHVDQILAAFEAGLHACTEKPMVTSVKDAERVIAARDKAGKVGMVSYQRHFQPEYRYIRSQILSGEAGKVTYVQALLCQDWLRLTKGSWRQDPALSGGGQLNDSGSHLVDVLLWATGLKMESVQAICDNRGSQVDIDSSLTIRFQGGAIGALAIIGDTPGWHEDVTICCENRAYYLREGKLTILDREGNKLKAEHLAGESTPDRNFVDACLGRAECESPFECGLEVIRLTEAAWGAAEERIED
jgi:predicted dehydrogenase